MVVLFHRLLKSIDSIEGLVDTTYNMNAMTWWMNKERMFSYKEYYRVYVMSGCQWVDRREVILYITGGVCSVADTFYIGCFYITNRGRVYMW